jgi:hypothetical protein
MNNETDDYDPDFGYMQHNGIDAWDCNVSADFPHPPTYYFAIHLWEHEENPTECQRQRIRWLKARYAFLWPALARTIVELHPELTDVSQLNGAIRDWVGVHLSEFREDSVELVFNLDLPNEQNRGYFITLSELGIEEAHIAD